VEGENVVAEAIAVFVRGPHHPGGQVIPAGGLQPVPFEVEGELFADLPQTAVGRVAGDEVDVPAPPAEPRLAGRRSRVDPFRSRLDERTEGGPRDRHPFRRVQHRRMFQPSQKLGTLLQVRLDLVDQQPLVIAPRLVAFDVGEAEIVREVALIVMR